jgi:hypothetical protein
MPCGSAPTARSSHRRALTRPCCCGGRMARSAKTSCSYGACEGLGVGCFFVGGWRLGSLLGVGGRSGDEVAARGCCNAGCQTGVAHQQRWRHGPGAALSPASPLTARPLLYAHATPTSCRSGHKNAILQLAWFPSGEHIVTASADKSVRCWDADTGLQVRPPRLISRLLAGQGPPAPGVDRSSPGSALGLGASTQRGRQQLAARQQGRGCSARAALSSSTAAPHARPAAQVKRLSEHTAVVNSVCPMHRGPELFVSGSDDGSVKVRPRPAAALRRRRRQTQGLLPRLRGSPWFARFEYLAQQSGQLLKRPVAALGRSPWP